MAVCKVSAKLQCLTRLEITTISASSYTKGALSHSSHITHPRAEPSQAAQLLGPFNTERPKLERTHKDH